MKKRRKILQKETQNIAKRDAKYCKKRRKILRLYYKNAYFGVKLIKFATHLLFRGLLVYRLLLLLRMEHALFHH